MILCQVCGTLQEQVDTRLRTSEQIALFEQGRLQVNVRSAAGLGLPQTLV